MIQQYASNTFSLHADIYAKPTPPTIIYESYLQDISLLYPLFKYNLKAHLLKLCGRLYTSTLILVFISILVQSPRVSNAKVCTAFLKLYLCVCLVHLLSSINNYNWSKSMLIGIKV